MVKPDGTSLIHITSGGVENNWLSGWTQNGEFLVISSNIIRQQEVANPSAIGAPGSSALGLANSTANGLANEFNISGSLRSDDCSITKLRLEHSFCPRLARFFFYPPINGTPDRVAGFRRT